jgi:hypothetical protein
MKYLIMRNSAMALGMILGMGSMAQSQATTGSTPVYNPGPTLPLIDGTFQYSLFASEVAQTGYVSGVSSSTDLGGSMEYASKSVTSPFSMIYSGGYIFNTQSGVGSSTFQGLSASQGLIRGAWVLGITDSVSFLPNSPAPGLSGIPGTGDIGVQPITGGTIPVQTLLTEYSRRISNSVSGDIERSLTPRTSISGVGSYGILRFIDNDGQDSSQLSGSVALNHRLDARNTLSGNVSYGTYSFSGFGVTQPSINIRGINGVYERVWSRSVSTTVSVGPQWISGYTLTPLQLQGYPPGTNPVVPGRVTVAVSASASYTHQHTSASLGYTSGVNGGSGVQSGSTADAFMGQVSRSFGINWSGGASASLARTVALIGGTPTQTYSVGVQVSRRISRHFSAYASDTVQGQSIGSYVGSNAFNGTTNSASIGITYSPRSTHLGQF